jgi:dTDP-glucose 4,6-dehydratase
MSDLEGTILVTGGMGFIGSNFVRHILSTSPAVRVVNFDKLTYAGNPRNLTDIQEDSRYIFIRGDICDEGEVTQAFEDHHPETIVHFAAESHVDRSIQQAGDFIRTNVQGTRVLLDAGRRWSIRRFLHISTDEVYGTLGESGAFTEESPLLPNSPYAASKAGADVLARSYHVTYGLPVITTRTCNNYGPYQFPEKFIPLMIVNALRGAPLPIYGDGLYVREWLHVEDHCRALARILTAGRPGDVYNIGSGEERVNLDVAKEILALTGQSESLIRHVQDRLGHDRRYALRWDKVRHQLNWTPAIPFATGVRQTVEWYKTHTDWWQEILSGEYQTYYERQYGGGGGAPRGHPGGTRNV